MKNELEHYGTPRHSGRYPWGSGEDPYQHEDGFYGQVTTMRKSGMSEKEIAKAMGMSTTVLRQRLSIAKDELKASRAAQALRLKDKGYSNTKIGELLSPDDPLPESTVRNLLKPALTQRANATREAAETLKEAVKENQYIDVGAGTEIYLGVSKTKMNTALQLLKEEGYEVKNIQVDQLGTDHKTTIKVLCPPEHGSYSEIYQNLEKIAPPMGHRIIDTGTTAAGIKPPVSIDPDRVAIRYAEDGGTLMDGVILLRPTSSDLTLGESRYAQVRVKVGDGLYLKGMAMYSDDIPEGKDILFNTNKHEGTPFNKVLKELKDDPDNPFGATVSQREYTDKDGTKHLSPLNIVNEEGSWEDWSRSLSSQMLSKQPVPLAKRQLDQAYDEKKKEFDEIMSLTNPVVKAKLLKEFSDECDSSAVHLKAAALPRQSNKVILPFPDMDEGEVYAPGYRDGEKVVLIRHPHGGTFEIPTLTVNNSQKTADKYIHNAKDAIGINAKVAERLSGADFDGDTVLVIPVSSGPGSKVKTSAPLKGLEGFSPTEYYPAYDGMPKVSDKTGFHKQTEMGKISNLITDMTIKGAKPDEIARAVRHSMVVIDAEKHNLNWKQSFVDNGIAELKEKYQGGKNKGASTLISKAKSEARVPQRSQRIDIDPETGEKIFRETGSTYEKGGRTITRMSKSTKMAETKDARELSSGTEMEEVYADYANRMKALGNEARKEYIHTPSLKYSPSAKKTYQAEVDTLNSKLMVAKKNAPLERQAQLKANLEVSAKLKNNPDLDKDQVKRLKGQALTGARIRTGANKIRVKITPKEWEAIQAGAITGSKLKEILDNTDTDVVRAYATPRKSSSLSSSQLSRAKRLLDSGNYTQAEVADQLGISVSTLYNALNK